MYPYTKFGFNLWRLREAKGKSSKETSEHLSMTLKDYQNLEMGKVLPSENQIQNLSEFLNEEMNTLKNWVVLPARKVVRGKVSDRIVELEKRLDNDIASIKSSYEHQSNTKLNSEQMLALSDLKNKILSTIDLPVLPMNFILICDALSSIEAKQYTFLHEYKDFIMQGESLAGFLSRDIYFGPFIFFSANQLYFSNKPFTHMEDCFEALSFQSFKHLFLLACVQNGIYEFEVDMPRLQQHADFTSLSCLFVRELKKEFKDSSPEDIDLDLLYQACILQGIGQYVLFETIKPTLLGTHSDYSESDEGEIAVNFETQIFKDILWKTHSTVSAILAANWLFSNEVVDILLTHHDHPVSRVTPNTALLKIINFFVDKDFPQINKADLDDLMKAYPQVKISTTVIHKICMHLSKIKADMYERSSTLLEESHQSFINWHQKSKLNDQNPHIAIHSNFETPLKRTDFRFSPQFQTVLKNVAHQNYENLLLETLLPQKNESLKNLSDRQSLFNISLRFLITKSLDDVAKEFGLSHDEVQIRLQKLKA